LCQERLDGRLSRFGLELKLASGAPLAFQLDRLERS